MKEMNDSKQELNLFQSIGIAMAVILYMITYLFVAIGTCYVSFVGHWVLGSFMTIFWLSMTATIIGNIACKKS